MLLWAFPYLLGQILALSTPRPILHGSKCSEDYQPNPVGFWTKCTLNACILSLVSVLVTTIKYRLLGLHFKIEINEITGVNQKEVLLSSGPRPI